MNSAITFPPPAPALKLARPSAEKWAATLAEERRRLQEDQEALREREENLREYEARLRSLQAEIEAGRTVAVPASTSTPRVTAATRTAGSGTTAVPFHRPSSRAPFTDDTALQAAWEKLHRARELLEAEQTHLRDDRIAMRDMEAALKTREQAIAEREARLAEREALVLAAMSEKEIAAAANVAATESAVTKITTAPFKMARAVLRVKK